MRRCRELGMRRPQPVDLPPRRSDNDKRRLVEDPPPALLERLESAVNYAGSSKHKLQPRLYGLPPFNGKRGDATLCDEHAGFQPEDMRSIPILVRRGIRAGLISEGGRIIWAVANDGWMFEFRQTNVAQSEYHGYPLRPTEAIAEPVFRRFARWAQEQGAQIDRDAAVSCRRKYRFRDA